MVNLDVDHRTFLDFVDSKKARGGEGLGSSSRANDPPFTGEARKRLFPERQPISVRVTDEFMRAVENGAMDTHAVVGGAPMDTHHARDIFRRMAEAAHVLRDPASSTTPRINEWNPVSQHRSPVRH